MNTVNSHSKTSKNGTPFFVRAYNRKIPITEEQLKSIKIQYSDDDGYKFQTGQWLIDKVEKGELRKPDHVDHKTWNRFRNWLKESGPTIAGAGLLGGLFTVFFPAEMIVFGLIGAGAGAASFTAIRKQELSAKEIKRSFNKDVLQK